MSLMEKPSLRDIKNQHSQEHTVVSGGAEMETEIFHLSILLSPAVVLGGRDGTSKLPMVAVLNLLLVPVPGATVRAPHGALARGGPSWARTASQGGGLMKGLSQLP